MCLDPIILLFLVGIIAKLVWPKVKLPALLYTIISSFLLVSIGLKGGIELCSWASWQLALQVLAIIALSVLTFLVTFKLLSFWQTSSQAENIVIAGHYGSVSVGTFAIALAILEHSNIAFEAYMPLFVALMESPAIIMALLMLKQEYHDKEHSVLGSIWSALNCKSIYILTLSIVLGYLIGERFISFIEPVFFDPFKIVLAAFLFEMGILVGQQLDLIKKHAKVIVVQAVTLSLSCAFIGLLVGLMVKLSLGGVILLMVLASSASYIAVPAALRQSYPQSNVPLALSYSLGVTFPFNVFIGIYIYMYIASYVFKYLQLDPSVASVC